MLGELDAFSHGYKLKVNQPFASPRILPPEIKISNVKEINQK